MGWERQIAVKRNLMSRLLPIPAAYHPYGHEGPADQPIPTVSGTSIAPHRKTLADGLTSSRPILHQLLDHLLGLDRIAAAEQVGVIKQVIQVIERNPATIVAG